MGHHISRVNLFIIIALCVVHAMSTLQSTGRVAAVAADAHPVDVGVRLESLELVTDQAVPGSGGNCWGGHQTRIVRTRRGVFTSYTVMGQGYTAREWRLAQRTATGWQVIAHGVAGREPVNLLQGPQDRLYLIAWPEGQPRLWTSTIQGGRLSFSDALIPGDWGQTDWPYQGASINAQGDLYVIASGGERPGEFKWATYQARTAQWSFHVTPLDYRFCYTYVIPGDKGQLAIVSTRDVRWESLGYTKLAGAFDYVFNAVKCWSSPDALHVPLQELLVREEKPSAQFPDPYCDAQTDAYVDTKGRLHILYWRSGQNTEGRTETRHAMLENGKLIQDVPLPPDAGHYCRITQDARGRFCLITADADKLVVYRAATEDGLAWGPPVQLALKGYTLTYSGIALAAPRCGTPLSNTIDGVFPAGKENQWVYFRLRLE